MQIPRDLHMLRRRVVLCAALFAFQALALAQPTIVGPDTGKPGQALSYQLLDQGKPVSGVMWKQGFNPDRYSGNDYATSFTLKLTAQTDGSVQFVAPSPGRYRLVATQNGARFATAVLIRPAQAPFPIRGLVFDQWGSSAVFPSERVRFEATTRLALVKHFGVNWIALVPRAYIELNQQDYVVTYPHPMTISQVDLEWTIDEAHRQGYSVVLYPGLNAFRSGVDESDLQLSLPALTDNQILAVQAAYSQFHKKLSVIAQQHNVEAMFVGSNWQLPSTASPVLIDNVNSGWNSLIDQLRVTYSGKLWFGWASATSTNLYWDHFPYWSKTDGIHVLSWLKGSGLLDEYPRVTGYNNIVASDMFPGISDFADLWAQQNYGVPVIVTDFDQTSQDSINWRLNEGVWDGITPIDTQEIVDWFEASMARINRNTPAGFFPWALGMFDFGRTSLLSYPTFVHALSNWYGGDPAYLDSCLAAQSSDVLFQTNFNCPLGRYQMWTFGGEDVNADSSDASTWILNVNGGGAWLRDIWQDFSSVQKVRFGSSGGISVRIRGSAYWIDLKGGTLQLTKHVGNAVTLLASSTLSANRVGVWRNLGIDGIGPRIRVTLDAETLIDSVDSDAPILVGVSQWFGTGSTGADIASIVVRKPSLVPATPDSPLVQAVVNAASYLGVTVAPGEIVTLFGTQMGPAKLAYFAPDQNGKIGTTLAGTRVLFDGVAAPVIYTQAGQVAAIVPFGVGANSTKVQVEYQGKTSPALDVPVTDTTPGIFTANSGGDGQAAAINQDGTFNSASNAASRGAVLTLFLTGHGQVNPSGVDGAIVTGTPPKLVAGVEVWIGHVPSQIQYAGVAPQSTNGLMQLNVVVPAGAPTGPDIPILVGMGHYVSQPLVTVAIK